MKKVCGAVTAALTLPPAVKDPPVPSSKCSHQILFFSIFLIFKFNIYQICNLCLTGHAIGVGKCWRMRLEPPKSIINSFFNVKRYKTPSPFPARELGVLNKHQTDLIVLNYMRLKDRYICLIILVFRWIFWVIYFVFYLYGHILSCYKILLNIIEVLVHNYRRCKGTTVTNVVLIIIALLSKKMLI